MREISYREAVREAMAEEMERDERVFLMGEEVGHYNGAYKVSEGLLDRFGERRVVDSPIAEAGFAGVGIGAAMVGLRPIIEFMTWNFSLCAYDQIVNNAAKLRYMSGGQLSLPIVFRGPGGAAHQLAAQHSQVVESLYSYVPGLKVMAPSTPSDAKGLLKSAIRDNNPTIFIEGEILYGRKGVVEDNDSLIPIGKADIKREGTDVTLVAWSKMVYVALEAAGELAKQSIQVEVIDPRTMRPLDDAMLIRSVKKTNRCVIVEEGWPVAGFGAEISHRITQDAFDFLDAPVVRVTGEDVPMPYAKNLEELVIPSVKKVVEAARSVMYRK